MNPLFSLFGCEVEAYSFMVSMGFISAFLWLLYIRIGSGVSFDKTVVLYTMTLISGILGARLLYVIVHYPIYMETPSEIFDTSKGGFVLYGGIAAALLATYCLAKIFKVAFSEIADLMTPCLMLGIFVGRWGCFFKGCCHGKLTQDTLPWSINFPFDQASVIPNNLVHQPIHPTQIYMSLNALLIFIITMYFLRKRKFNGQVFALGIALYALTRSFIEFFRGDADERIFIGPLSTSQWISAGAFCFAITLYLVMKNRAMQRPGLNR